MSRLPTVGGDSGSWGTVLNDYLSVQHNANGTHNIPTMVAGPASATDSHVVLFDGTTGKLVKDGGVLPTGNVVGPASATDGNIAVFDGTTGKLLKDGGYIVLKDNFNRADASTVGAPQIGDAPGSFAGTWGISNNQLAPKSNTTESNIIWGLPVSRWILTCTLATVPGDGGIIFRAQDGSNWLVAYCSGSKYELYQRVNSVYTLLFTGTHTPTNGDALEFRHSGIHIQLYVNSTLEIDYTIGIFNYSSHMVGFRENNQQVLRVDDLQVVAW